MTAELDINGVLAGEPSAVDAAARLRAAAPPRNKKQSVWQYAWQIAQQEDPDIAWAAEGFIPMEAYTAINAIGGSGKTYLMFGFLAALEGGHPLGNLTTAKGRMLLYSEESAGPLRDKVRRFAPDSQALIWNRADNSHMTLEELVSEQCNQIIPAENDGNPELPIVVVAWDVLSRFAGFASGETSDQAAVANAIDATRPATTLGCAVVGVHHISVKADPESKHGIGSTSWHDAPDVVWAMERVTPGGDDIRLTCQKSRYMSIPIGTVIQLRFHPDEDQFYYTRIEEDGAPAQAHNAAAEWQRKVLAWFREGIYTEKPSRQEVIDGVLIANGVEDGKGRTSVDAAINQLRKSGQVEMVGAAGDPNTWYRYRSPLEIHQDEMSRG